MTGNLGVNLRENSINLVLMKWNKSKEKGLSNSMVSDISSFGPTNK